MPFFLFLNDVTQFPRSWWKLSWRDISLFFFVFVLESFCILCNFSAFLEKYQWHSNLRHMALLLLKVHLLSKSKKGGGRLKHQVPDHPCSLILSLLLWIYFGPQWLVSLWYSSEDGSLAPKFRSLNEQFPWGFACFHSLHLTQPPNLPSKALEVTSHQLYWGKLIRPVWLHWQGTIPVPLLLIIV